MEYSGGCRQFPASMTFAGSRGMTDHSDPYRPRQCVACGLLLFRFERMKDRTVEVDGWSDLS